MNPDVLSFKNVAAGYGEGFRIHGVSFTLGRGDRCALLGSNGAGKSTLLRVAGGLMPASSGEARFRGQLIHEIDAATRARSMAGLPSNMECPLPLTVSDYVALGRTPHADSTSGTDSAVQQAVHAMELQHLLGHRMDRISAGERQRASLALVLAQEPSLLLLDEPTAHLDMAHSVGLHDELERRAQRDGLTVLFATHDLQMASDIATHVLLMKQGRLLAFGCPDSVLTAEALSEAYSTPVDVRVEAGTRWIRNRSAKREHSGKV